MNYETWSALNVVALVCIPILSLVMAVAVFLRRRKKRTPEGRATGQPVTWALAAFFMSFFVLAGAWAVTLQDGFPEYAARQATEWAGGQGAENAETSQRGVVAGVTGSWRPNNVGRSDYITFTTDTYASVTPEFDTRILYRYRVLRRDGPCMRIETSGSEVVQGGQITESSSRTGPPFTVCVDPETDQMLIRFASGEGDVFFTRMN